MLERELSPLRPNHASELITPEDLGNFEVDQMWSVQCDFGRRDAFGDTLANLGIEQKL